MRNILEYLEYTANIFKEKVAFYSMDTQITFEQLEVHAKRVGSALCEIIPVRQPILVLTNKKISNIVMFLGTVYAGCYYVPMDIDLPQSRISAILQVSNPSLVIGEMEDIKKLSSLDYHFKALTYEEVICTEINKNQLLQIRSQACDTDPLYTIFTSGSTGIPKGVITSHQAAIDYIEAFCEVTNINDSDILGNQAPLDYVAAIRDIYIPLKTGASTVLIPHKMFSMPAQLFEYLNQNHVTTLCWVASAFNLPVTYHAFDKVCLQYVNKVIFTGSVMSAKTLSVWQDNLPDAFYMNHYGPTEITASCTYYIVDHKVTADEILPIGKPFRNTQIILITEEGKEAEIGEKGEIYVGGCCLALGYMNTPEQTKRNFIYNPLNTTYPQLLYKTGDIGCYDKNGILWFYGRLDSQIKHMGHRVELVEIENAARTLDTVTECVCAYHTEKENIYLFYEGNADKRELACKLRETLPGFMVPRKFVRCEALPRLENGKINLNKLKEYFQS